MSAVSDASYEQAVGRPVDAAAHARVLFAQHHRRIYRHCLRTLRSSHDAEDALQQTFVNALQALRGGVVPRAEAAWLLRIAHNVCLERLRNADRRARLESIAGPDTFESVAAPSRPTIAEGSPLATALDGLEGRQRDVLILREWRGLSYREIGAVLEISQSAVESLLFRARRSLARTFEEGGRLRSALNWLSLLGSRRLFVSSTVGKTAAVAACCGVAAIATPALERAITHGGRPSPATLGAPGSGSTSRAPSVPAASRAVRPAAPDRAGRQPLSGATVPSGGPGTGSPGATPSTPATGGGATSGGSSGAPVGAGGSPVAATSPPLPASASHDGAVSVSVPGVAAGIDAEVGVGSGGASADVKVAVGPVDTGGAAAPSSSDPPAASAAASVGVGDAAAASVGASVGVATSPATVDVGVSASLPGP